MAGVVMSARFWESRVAQGRARVRRAVAAVAIASFAIAWLVVVSAQPAKAISADIRTTSDVGLYYEPSTASHPALITVPRGTSPDYVCWTRGESVQGLNVWFRVRYDGLTGYIASRYDDSTYKHATQIESKYGIPNCADVPEEAAVETPNSFYNRSAAVEWALAHARDKQAHGEMCTWFVSNALWAGGFATSDEWTSEGYFQSLNSRLPGTPTAWKVVATMNYLTERFSVSQFDLTSAFVTKAVPQAEPGDIIAYDWTGDGVYDHLSMVVRIADGQYPVVAEWGTAGWGADIAPWSSRSSYTDRGWTYSAKNKKLLQELEEYEGITAKLLHIDGGYYASSF